MEEMLTKLSRSILVKTELLSFFEFAKLFDINEKNCINNTQSCDYMFYKNKENATFYGELEGDFNYYLDLELFHTNEVLFFELLIHLSRENNVIALPDDDSESPYDYLLFKGGIIYTAYILEDKDSEQFYIEKVLSQKNLFL